MTKSELTQIKANLMSTYRHAKAKVAEARTEADRARWQDIATVALTELQHPALTGLPVLGFSSDLTGSGVEGA